MNDPDAETSPDDEFDCDSCTRRQWLDRLTSDDFDALTIYDQLAHPVVSELGLTPVVFQSLGLVCSRDDVIALLDRLRAIHEYHALKRQRRAKDLQSG